MHMHMRYERRRLQRLAVSAVLAFGVGGAHAELQVGIARNGAGDPRVSWSGGATGLVYGVEDTPATTAPVWRLTAPPDRWPVGETSWVATNRGESAFYRVRGTVRGERVSTAFLDAYDVNTLNFLLSLAGLPSSATYDVSIYRVTYTTFDHRGLATEATGALCVPVGGSAMPLVAFQHGTEFLRTDAPSNSGSADHLAGAFFAGSGYATVLTDYLGLGLTSPALHPYLHARSEAIACVDMLRASVDYLTAGLGVTLNGQLFLAGYSQGGHATLALQRELETHHTNAFSVSASAPMAGPYDLSGTMTGGLVSTEPYPSPAYVPYIVFGLNTVYRIFGSPGEVFKAPYDTLLPPMYRGTNTASEINAVMPEVPRDVFRDDFLAGLTNDPSHPLAVALDRNSLHLGWIPQATTRLYHCSGDLTVPPANSRTAYDAFVSNGAAAVSIVDPQPGADHGGCALPSLSAAKTWFDSLLTP